MIKRMWLWLALLVALFSLSACDTGQAAGAQAAGNGTGNSPGTPGSDGRSLSPGTRLALGIFRLDETEYRISPAQAQELLPLWKAMRTLNNSDTAAPQEVQGLLDQIESVLTPEQRSAIEAMQLSFRDMQVMAQQLGLPAGGGGFGGQNPALRATAQAARQGGQGGRPGGGGGGGFGGPGFPGGNPGGGQGGFNQQARQTAVARTGGRTSGVGVSQALVGAVIKFLQNRTQ